MHKVYYYSFKKGIFKVEEGITYIHKFFGQEYPRVRIPGIGRTLIYEGIHEKVIGKGGPHIWMIERDDELARKLFIEYEESLINNFLDKIEDKKKLIEILERRV